MKQILKWTGIVLVAAVVGLALAFAANTWSQSSTLAAYPYDQPAGVAPRTAPQSQSGYNPTGVYTSTRSSPYSGYGPGMMGGWGPSRRGGHMGGMMGGGARAGVWGNSGGSAPLTLDQAVEAARQYLSAYGNPDLVLTEVMEFSGNFYAEVKEESTGMHAFELLIDRYNGAVYLEPGPNMMWNTKYGHMGGMMGGWGSRPAGSVSVTPEQARNLAQGWLDRYLPGTSAAEKADAFYGYYTIHILEEDQVYGMLSVNSSSGDVWYHDWHGNFIGIKELEE